MKRILRFFGFHIHDWNYEWVDMEYQANHDHSKKMTMNTLTRTCINCGKKQIRTNLPRCNGYDDNKWITI